MATVLLVGAVVALSLGLYARLHTASHQTIFTLGFSGLLQMKAWLTTAAFFFILIQLVSALWTWDRLPGKPRQPSWLGNLHRWSGSIGFSLTLPVAFNCIWFCDNDAKGVGAQRGGLPLLRRVRGQDGRPTSPGATRLGLAGTGGHGVRAVSHPLVDGGSVAVHPTRDPTHVMKRRR